MHLLHRSNKPQIATLVALWGFYFSGVMPNGLLIKLKHNYLPMWSIILVGRSLQSPDKLSLALEPKSGAIYCHEMLLRKKVAYPDANISPLPPSYSYIIVDVGGGTVDVSAHRVSTTPILSVEELHHPVGNDWGGLQVNTSFSDFLQKLVKDRHFTRYLPINDMEARITNRFELDEILNNCFEK